MAILERRNHKLVFTLSQILLCNILKLKCVLLLKNSLTKVETNLLKWLKISRIAFKKNSE